MKARLILLAMLLSMQADALSPTVSSLQYAFCAPQLASLESDFCSPFSLRFQRGSQRPLSCKATFGTLALGEPRPAPTVCLIVGNAARNSVGEQDTVEATKTLPVPSKRRRGFGANFVDPVPSGISSLTTTAPVPQEKKRGRGFGSAGAKEKLSVREIEDREWEKKGWESGFYSVQEESSSSSEDELDKLDQGSSLIDAISILHAGGGSKPEGTRLRSRTAPAAYILPNTPKRRAQRGANKGLQGGSRQSIEMVELMRKSMATRGGSQKVTEFVHINPGSNPLASKRRGGTEEMGVVPLAELARRGLISPNLPSTQSVLASDSNIMKELSVNMAVFVLELVGNNLLSAGSDQKMTLWDREAWQTVSTLEGHTDWVNGIAVDEAKGFFCTASDDKTVRVWDLQTKKCLQVLDGHKDRAHAIAIGDTQIFVGCQNGIYVWDINTWTNTHRLTNHTCVLRAMTMGRQMSKNVAVADMVRAARSPATLFGHRVGGIVIAKPFMLTSVDDGTIWVWNIATLEVERKLLANTAAGVWVRPLLLVDVFDKKRNRKRTKIVSGWADGAIRVYDLQTWELEHTLCAHNGPVLCLDASDGRLLSTGSDMSVYEWDTGDWKIKRVLRGHRGAVCAVTGNDGQTITASLDGFIKVWDRLS